MSCSTLCDWNIRLLCPSLSPRVCSNSCPLSWCCHQRSHLLLPLSLSTLSLFQHQDFFSSESALCVRWPKDWSYSFSISPSNEYSGSISFRIDSFDLFAIRGTLNSLLQPHSLKASIVSLTVWTFVGKVMSLLFNLDLIEYVHVCCHFSHVQLFVTL